MSRREPDRKVHRFTSWWASGGALFILKFWKLDWNWEVLTQLTFPLQNAPVAGLNVHDA
jgi:hypothetical protein